MTKQKSTKRALLLSALSLLMCISMFVGSTFAWFTDSVTSAGNKIVSGSLDIQLLMHNGTDYIDISESTAPIFGEGAIAQNNNAETLWEPGKTQVAYLAIKNNGNLSLKYRVGLEVQNVSKNLYEVMEYSITPDAQYDSVDAWNSANGKSVVLGTQTVTASDTVMNPGDVHYFALSIHMDELAGNKYQDGEVNFDLTIIATQATVESDSFGTDYDADALNCDVIATPETIDSILANATEGTVIGLAAGSYGEIVMPKNNLTLVSNSAVVDFVDFNGKWEKMIAEGAGAVAVAAAMFNKVDVIGKNVVCLLSGGNIDVNILSRVINRGLLMTGRTCQLLIEVLDKPGQLNYVSSIIARLGANIISIEHERVNYSSNINECYIRVTLETKNFEHIEAIKKELIDKGFTIK